MAGGKLSARQKMINLMYLVFIAMLAMNMSKKVLSSFGSTMTKLNQSNIKVGDSNNKIIQSLAKKATEQPEKYKDKFNKAKVLKGISDKYFAYLGDIYDQLESSIKEEDRGDWEGYDSDAAVNKMFFVKEGKLSEEGQRFLDKMIAYRESAAEMIEDESLKIQVLERFATKDEVVGTHGNQPFMNAHFEGFPLITTLKDIRQIQTDIRTTESDTYNTMLKGALVDDAKLTNYVGIVALDKTAYFSGETVTGKIVMGKFDETFTADYKSNVGGKMENGQVALSFRAGNAGSHPIKGTFTFKQKDGEDIVVPFDSEYTVITEPSSAVISADKMNVVYRGLSNPMSISVPGVGAGNVKATAPGLQNKGGGKYILKPSTGKDVTINVSAKLSSGKVINTPKKFRIMDIPAPQGAIRGQTGAIAMPKASLAKAGVSVVLKDFVFDLTLRTTSFSVKVPGQATIKVNGARMNAKAASAINKARRGDTVAIFDIKSTIVGEGSGLRVKNASTVLVEIK